MAARCATNESMKSAVVIALCMVGCGGENDARDAGEDPPPTAVIPGRVNRDLDLLFVIDDTSSMAEVQDRLAAAFPALVKRLSTVYGGVPDLHLGVVTTDMGTSFGSMGQSAPSFGTPGDGGCAGRGKAGTLTVSGAPVTGTFLVDTAMPDGTRQKNYSGDIAAAFAQMTRVGIGGCGFEQPLAAMRAALDNNAANAGFLRPQSNLIVIFVTDEDDCSARAADLFAPESAQLGTLQSFRCTRFGLTCDFNGATPEQMNLVGGKGTCRSNPSSAIVEDIKPYVTFLNTLRPDERLLVFSLAGTRQPVVVEPRDIAGVMQPALASSCTFPSPTGLRTADPAPRIAQLVDAFVDGFPYNVCSDHAQILDAIGITITDQLGTDCLYNPPLDVDPATPGLQFSCFAKEVDGSRTTPLGECNAATSPPCWNLVEDPVACPFAPNLRFVVKRVVEPSPSTQTALFCTNR